ncbi:MAG: hypothetical protein U5K79_03065 [Cyclobacteriaceae bacterium]|nr:hypothetical protein [Cyclobacteriaceae bacterium]
MKKHKITIIAVYFALFVLVSGCGIFSIHPLFHQKDLIVQTKLIGTWKEDSDSPVWIKIDTTSEKTYLFTVINKEDTLNFVMGLLQLQGQYFIDLFPDGDCSLFSGGDCLALENMVRNYIPAHTFMKFEMKDGEIYLTEFDNERLIKLFQENRIRLAHEIPGNKDDDDDYVVITASTDDLQKFITRYANDKEAFSETVKYTKVKS